MTPEPARAAGWYDDETDAALLRYWDGAKWSPHTAPKPADAATSPVDAIDEATSVRARAAVPEDTAALFRDVSTPVLVTLPAPPPTPAAPRAGVIPVAPPPSRAPDEHTTVPLPPGDAVPGASGPRFSYEPYRTTGRTFIATWLFALLLGFWGADRFYL